MVKRLSESHIQEWLLHKYMLIFVATVGEEIPYAMVGNIRPFHLTHESKRFKINN